MTRISRSAACFLAILAAPASALDPVPADLAPVYLFNGVQASTADNSGIHTAVTCTLHVDTTGLTPAPTTQVEFYDQGGDNLATVTLSPGGFFRSTTYTTGGILSDTNEVVIGSVPATAIRAGLIRVLASKKYARYLQCTAKLVNADSLVPTYSVELPGERSGKFSFPKPAKP